MKRLLLTLACVVMLASSALAVTKDRVVNLPQDGGMWYVSLFGEQDNVDFQKLQAWFNTDKGLLDLKSQTHFNVYTTDTLRFRRYAQNLPGLACVRVQTSKGQVVSEFWASYVPSTSSQLYEGIVHDMQHRTKFGCIFGRRPQPNPTPIPIPGPPDVVDVPPTIAEEPEPEVGFPILLAILAAVGGLAAGVASGYKAEHIDSISSLNKI